MTSAFAPLGLSEKLCETVARLGFEEPTPIQSAAVPELIKGGDVLGQAATGTGKTAAFALPVLKQSPVLPAYSFLHPRASSACR